MLFSCNIFPIIIPITTPIATPIPIESTVKPIAPPITAPSTIVNPSLVFFKIIISSLYIKVMYMRKVNLTIRQANE